MTTAELRGIIFEDLNAIMDDEPAMEKLKAYLEKLKKKVIKAKRREDSVPPLKPLTMEEIRARLKQSEEDYKAGRVYTIEEAEEKTLKEFPWLR